MSNAKAIHAAYLQGAAAALMTIARDKREQTLRRHRKANREALRKDVARLAAAKR